MPKKKNALIGFTGFVGGNLLAQTYFDDLFNSANILDLKGKEYDLLVCAGARAEKWRINQEPEKDLTNINLLISCLKEAKIKKCVLISTVDVYPKPVDVNEDTIFDPRETTPYGQNRYFLEQFCQETFDTLVVRLPGLFGKGLKKNAIYDFLNNNNLEQIHADSIYQFYNLDHLWQGINIALENNLRLINFATEPVKISQIAKLCFGLKFNNRPVGKNPAFYDFKTKYDDLFHGNHGYIYNKDQVLKDLKKFVRNYQKI